MALSDRSRPLRVGIVGCGSIARNHLEAYRAAPGVEVVGCCDVDVDRAHDFAAAHGVPTAVQTVAELLGHGLDVVSVCTPHPTHEEVVLAAAAAGTNVLCEKPIAVTLEAAQRMVDACRRAGVALGVVFQRRFWPAAQRIRAAIDDGRLADPFLGRCSVILHREPSYYLADAWRGRWATDGGGALLTQGIHYVDLLQWYLGKAVEVTASFGTFVHSDSIEVEDTLVASARFASGALATIEVTTAADPGLGAEVRITGRGGATASLLEYPEGAEAVNELWALPDGDHRPVTRSVGGPQPDLGLINSALIPFHVAQVADFVTSLREGRDPAITGEDGLAALRIVLACYTSAREGRTVRLDELKPAGAGEPS